MSTFGKTSLTHILIVLLVVSLLMNFFLTIKQARKETKLNLTKPAIIEKSEQNLVQPTSKEDNTPSTPPITTQEIISNPNDESTTIVDEKPTLKTNVEQQDETIKPTCPTPIGNKIKSEVLQQRAKRKRFPPNDSPIQTLPTFTPMEIKKGNQLYTILNDYWIPKDTVFDLIILMPTMARIDNETDTILTYLNSTISEYYKQLKLEEDPIIVAKKILFIIQAFPNEKEHVIFHQLREEYRHVEEFIFFVPPFRFMDPYRDIPNVNYWDSNNPYPGKMARQQTCDIAFLTEFTLRNFKFKYLMYTEDDFVPCPGFLRNVFDVLADIEWFYSDENTEREEFDKGFCSLKMSVGLGGMILTPVSAEVYLTHIKDNIELEPIDILILFIAYSREMMSTFDTCVRRGLTSYVYRLSKLEHIGGFSNWAERNNQAKFGNRLYSCGYSLEGGVLWDVGHVNRFNTNHRKCPKNNQKIIPCI